MQRARCATSSSRSWTSGWSRRRTRRTPGTFRGNWSTWTSRPRLNSTAPPACTTRSPNTFTRCPPTNTTSSRSLFPTSSSHIWDFLKKNTFLIAQNKLLEKLLLYATKNEQQQVRLIQRKLNSTLAKLALYLIEDQWENCIVDMIQTIPNCINGQEVDQTHLEQVKMQLIAIVLDLLTLLPEELANCGNLPK